MEVALLRITGDPEFMIASVARVSYPSEGKGLDLDRDLIRSLIKRGHELVLEHATATIEITGISRICANRFTRLWYKELIPRGAPKEDARYVIPTGPETSLVVTANFREWRHILKLMLHRSALWETRELAQRILGILQKRAPAVFEDLGGAA